MESYLINVAITFVPYLLAAILLHVGIVHFGSKAAKEVTSAVYRSDEDKEEKANIDRSVSDLLGFFKRIVIPGILVLGLVISLTSPSHTYKHPSGHDRQQRDAQIKQLNTQPPANVEIKNLSRQPEMTPEERAERLKGLSDWRNRE